MDTAWSLSSKQWRVTSYRWCVVITLILLPRNSIIGAFSIHPRPATSARRYRVDLSVASSNNDNNDIIINNNNDNDYTSLSENVPRDGKNLRHAYARARNIRTLQGHDAGVPYYQEVLRQNPDDRTAGTRLAASAETPQRQEEACGGKFCISTGGWEKDLMSRKADIQTLQALLVEHSYNHESVAQFFGVPTNQYPLSCNGPLFASPVAPGSVTMANYPLSHSTGNVSGLSCLVALFLLSLVVPRAWIVEQFGEANCTLLQDFGWIHPCSANPSLMIPYVNVFPLDFDNNDNKSERLSLYLVTDLHPRVLSTTTVGESLNQTGNAVMYIGPDSLALVQHFAPYTYLMDKMDTTVQTQSSGSSSPAAMQGLDFGTGCGVQALSALMHWKIASKNKSLYSDTHTKELKMTAIDINPRALRFTRFNAILNGLEEYLTVVQADLVSGNLLVDESSNENLEQYLQVKSPYDLILANPPFLPVPSDNRTVGSSEITKANRDGVDTSATTDSIAQRYGLFSSGGGDGEVLLQCIVELASRYLSPGGVLGVVSEFFEQEHDPDFERFSAWWSQHSPGYSNEYMAGRKKEVDCIPWKNGLLFVNEFPIDVATYSARRADNSREEMIWNHHLESLNITAASPGMLYIQKGDGLEPSHQQVKLLVSRVPKTKLGSVWTPSNFNAIRFTQGMSHEAFGWP